MNIFVLDRDPVIAANYHCDQHIHKMVLESAQIVSTAIRESTFGKEILANVPELQNILYKSAYPKHPCVLWATQDDSHVYYVCRLGFELENIRLSAGHNPHKSTEILKAVADNLPLSACSVTPNSFALAMPAFIRLRSSIDEVEKYRLYYQFKARTWRHRGKLVTYKNREVPEFMKSTLANMIC